MEADKLRNLTDAELLHQQRELNDQLFKLKFQLKMGQTESLTKIRGLRKDVARVHTVMREKQLGLVRTSAPAAEPVGATATAAAEPATKTRQARPATRPQAKAKTKARKK